MTQEHRTVAGLSLEVLTRGQGSPVLILHDYEYLNRWYPFQEQLSRGFQLTVPSHPGFGKSDLPKDFDSVDDLAYLYLDMVSEMEPVDIIGMGVGGWIAAEMAVRSDHDINRLVLVDAVGIKVGDREARDIADTFISGPEAFLDLAWHDPKAGAAAMKLPGLGQLPEDELTELLRNRQTAALLTWKPFMHNPKLQGRLRRITPPALVLWGERDRIASPDYGRAYAEAIPGARFETIPNAGHYPYLEQPDAFVAAVRRFLT